MTYSKGSWQNSNYSKHQKSYERKQDIGITTREVRRFWERISRKECKAV